MKSISSTNQRIGCRLQAVVVTVLLIGCTGGDGDSTELSIHGTWVNDADLAVRGHFEFEGEGHRRRSTAWSIDIGKTFQAKKLAWIWPRDVIVMGIINRGSRDVKNQMTSTWHSTESRTAASRMRFCRPPQRQGVKRRAYQKTSATMCSSSGSGSMNG